MASFQSWRDAVSSIKKTTCSVTPSQKQLAELADIDIPTDLPMLVAAARLRRLYRVELILKESPPSTTEQHRYLKSLETDDYLVTDTPIDNDEVRAWVLYLRLRKRAQSLACLQIESGDIVEVNYSGESHVEEVSSIGSNGCVYFKGGSGARAWPDNVVIKCRRNDCDEAAVYLKREAGNSAARRTKLGPWSDSKQELVDSYIVQQPLEDDDLFQLEEIINSAVDERPIQRFLTEKPQLLTAVLVGKERFCIPQQRLGEHYVADFLIADVNSLGIRWVLVELETPKSKVTLKDTNELEQHARKGSSQVQEWRDWIQNNIASARQPKKMGGHGLVDIRPMSQGLVFVGRRALLRDNSRRIRAQISEQQGIQIHTYDWLLDVIQCALEFEGPPSLKPFGLRSFSDSDLSPF